jgi:hypothetical protein
LPGIDDLIDPLVENALIDSQIDRLVRARRSAKGDE